MSRVSAPVCNDRHELVHCTQLQFDCELIYCYDIPGVYSARKYWKFISILETLEISRNLIGTAGKLPNVGGKAVIHSVLVSWLDVTVMSVGRSSSSHSQLEIVHTLLVVVVLLIKL